MLPDDSPLDCDRILDDPQVWMGEMPRYWEEIPARVVVNLAGVCPPGSSDGRVVFSLPLTDSPREDALPDRADLERFLASVHPWVSAEPSYWHCHAGINRSGLVLAAWLHLHQDLPISQAIALLRARRSGIVLCNNVFEQALRRWYGGPDEQDFQPFTLEVYLRERRRRRERGMD